MSTTNQIITEKDYINGYSNVPTSYEIDTPDCLLTIFDFDQDLDFEVNSFKEFYQDNVKKIINICKKQNAKITKTKIKNDLRKFYKSL